MGFLSFSIGIDRLSKKNARSPVSPTDKQEYAVPPPGVFIPCLYPSLSPPLSMNSNGDTAPPYSFGNVPVVPPLSLPKPPPPLPQLPLHYHPFQAGFPFQQSDGSGDRSTFPDNSHFPFVPSSAFPHLGPASPPTPPKPRTQRRVPPPSAIPAVVQPKDILSHYGSVDMEPVREKGKGRGRPNIRVHTGTGRSRVSMPPVNGGCWRSMLIAAAPATVPPQTRHSMSTPPVGMAYETLKRDITPPYVPCVLADTSARNKGGTRGGVY